MRIFIVRIGIQAKAVRSGKKCHQRFGTGTLLFCRHIVDFLLSINICTETVADRSLFTCKNKRTVLIHFNREGAGVNRVSVCTNQLTETIEFCVQRENTFFCRVVRSVILDGYGVGNLISSDQFSVPVINISSCTLKGSGFVICSSKLSAYSSPCTTCRIKSLPIRTANIARKTTPSNRVRFSPSLRKIFLSS